MEWPDTQALGAAVVAGALAMALVAMWRERRRTRRRDPDAVGAVDWLTVQLLAWVVLAATGIVMLHG